MLCVLSLQLCSTVCNPMDCSQPSSSVHGICQARILDWVAISSSRGSSPSRDHRGISFGSCIAGRFFTTEPLRKPHIQAYVHILFVSSSNETIQRPLHRKRQKKQSGWYSAVLEDRQPGFTSGFCHTSVLFCFMFFFSFLNWLYPLIFWISPVPNLLYWDDNRACFIWFDVKTRWISK